MKVSNKAVIVVRALGIVSLASAILGCSSNAPPTRETAGSGNGGSAGSPLTGGAAGINPTGSGAGTTAASGGGGGGAAGSPASGGIGNDQGGLGGQGSLEGGAGGAGAGGGGGALGSAGRAAGGAAGAPVGAGGQGGSAGATQEPSKPGPPMGWASWNTFAAKINYGVIKGQADAMVSSGLKAAGYQYVNIDEGWWQGTRDSMGNITIDQADWPGGMKAIADYIHGLGLKAGIYTDAGKDGCGYYFPTGRPAAPGSGSEGHYDQDFLAFSQWGFDFVKVDWCGGDKEKLDAPTAYKGIASAIDKATKQTGRPMVLSVCNWGNQSPWNWAPALSTMWRTSYDIIYFGENADMSRVLDNFDSAQHPAAQSPGHYNDPDMLIVGMSGFSGPQNRTHFALWAISGAPLLAGNNLATMNADTKSVLTNSEVLAINQDPLAKQGVRVSDAQGKQVYSKELSGNGRRAVLLLNRSTAAASITVRFADIGVGAKAAVRNVWTAQDLGSQMASYSATVPAQDSVLLLVTATP